MSQQNEITKEELANIIEITTDMMNQLQSDEPLTVRILVENNMTFEGIAYRLTAEEITRVTNLFKGILDDYERRYERM